MNVRTLHPAVAIVAFALGRVGITPDYVDATAQVTVAPQSDGFKITKSHLVCRAKVPGIDQATFMQHAEAAKAGCPVSQALAGTEVSLEAKLVDKESADPPS
jgi:osmotically inducible protein OsmC